MTMKEADDIWRNVMSTLLQQIEIERQNAAASANSEPLLQRFYTTYMNCYKQLERCYTLQVQPQKRLVIRKTLDAVVARTIEVKQQLAELMRDPFPDMYQTCADGTQLPEDFQIPPPRYATQDRPVLLQRNQLMKLLIEKYNVASSNASMFDRTHTLPNYKVGCGLISDKQTENQSMKMTLTEAILIIQKTERGRNARVRANLFKNLEKNRPEALLQKDVVVNREAAAISLQRYWRGILRSRKANAKKQAELVFMGLATETIKGKSLLPMVQTLVGKPILNNQKANDLQKDQQIHTIIEQLQKSLYQPNKSTIESIALPHQCQLALCPLSSQIDPATCDPLESFYSLARQVDRINLIQVPNVMKTAQNISNSAFPLAPECIKQLVLKQTALYMASDAYKNIMSDRKIEAIMQTNRQIYDADQDSIKEEVELDEAEELKAELRKRHWNAINDFIINKQLDDEENPVKDIVIPNEPLPIQTKDEQEMMDQVKRQEEALMAKAKKGKKGKAKKTLAEGNDQVDEIAKQMSMFMTDIVDSTVEYFIHWQRHEQPTGEVYDSDFVKELFRPKVFKDVFESVWEEIQKEIDKMKGISDMIKEMDGKKKGKKSKGSKKSKKAKKFEYVPPQPVGPVGDIETETGFAELVQEGIIKIQKPASFNDFVCSESFFSANSKKTLLLKREAEAFLGMKRTPEEEKEEEKVKTAPPSTSNIRNTIIQNVIWPLCSPSIRQFVPHPNKLLLFGAPGSGKTLLTRIIATQLGALFIDLSPANLINKFPTSEIPYLFSKIKAVAAASQPCVIYIDEVELVLGLDKAKGKKAKGKGKGDDGETPGASMAAEGYPKQADQGYSPQRLKKELVKLLKTFGPESGVIIIGNATRTFGREKALADFFDQMIYMSLPDYSLRMKLISEYLTKLGLPQYAMTGVAKDMRCVQPERTAQDISLDLATNALGLMGLQKGTISTGVGSGKFFDLSALVRVTDGFSAGQIEQIIYDTLGANRLQSIGQRPLDVQEFLPAIQNQPPRFDSIIAHSTLYEMNKVPQRKEAVDPKKPVKK
ncbi:Spastin [Hexamita inflata]|uniref:Spastin n=1 Tax=Hexamita inflata TaxID=28002 RepID=A0AA86UQR2_9EUKA|nr:Spastin [Hexamita inflata]